MKENTARCLDTENLVKECEQDLICRICLQFMVHPSYTDCGHVFGDNCIKRWKGDCPFCRQKITKFTVHEELKQKAFLVEGLCLDCQIRLPAKDLLQHFMNCQKRKVKNLAILRGIVCEQKQLLDIEINPHLFQFHGEIYDTYVNKWDWLIFDNRGWKWWWYKNNPWWNNTGCHQCQSLLKIYQDEIEKLQSTRISLIQEMNIKTLEDTEIKE